MYVRRGNVHIRRAMRGNALICKARQGNVHIYLLKFRQLYLVFRQGKQRSQEFVTCGVTNKAMATCIYICKARQGKYEGKCIGKARQGNQEAH